MALVDKPLLTLAFADNNAKVGAVSFALDVQNDYDTAESALRIAVTGVVNGSLKEHGVYDRTIEENRVIGIKASDKGHKWRLTVRDTVTGRIETYGIPTANYLLRGTDTDEMDMTLPSAQALKTAVETHMVSTVFNPVVFVSCMYEG